MKFTELIDECEKYLNSKKTEEDELELKSTFCGIKIQKRVAFVTKKAIITLIDITNEHDLSQKNGMALSDFDDSLEYRSIIEKNLFYCGLIPYTDIEKDVDVIDFTQYEIALVSGLIDYIEEFCAKDYKELKDMYLDIINLGSLIKATKAFEDIGNSNIEESLKSIKEIQGKLSKEELESIKAVFENNDPVLRDIKKEFEELARKTALEKEN